MGYGGQVGGVWGFFWQKNGVHGGGGGGVWGSGRWGMGVRKVGYGDFSGKKMGCIEVEGVGYRGGRGGVWGSSTPLSSPPIFGVLCAFNHVTKYGSLMPDFIRPCLFQVSIEQT